VYWPVPALWNPGVLDEIEEERSCWYPDEGVQLDVVELVAVEPAEE
jgi:hypothetical protein